MRALPSAPHPPCPPAPPPSPPFALICVKSRCSNRRTASRCSLQDALLWCRVCRLCEPYPPCPPALPPLCTDLHQNQVLQPPHGVAFAASKTFYFCVGCADCVCLTFGTPSPAFFRLEGAPTASRRCIRGLQDVLVKGVQAMCTSPFPVPWLLLQFPIKGAPTASRRRVCGLQDVLLWCGRGHKIVPPSR